MTARRLTLAGVMTGTSADGLDVALVEFGPARETGPGGAWGWRLLGFQHTAYAPALRRRILRLAAGEAPLAELARLDAELGERIGEAVVRACRRFGVAAGRLAAVASHGQTVYHEGGVTTLQIGDAARIAARTGCEVISDFRRADIAAGGQGAPLVPFADYLLYRSPTRYRVALNLGGIANLTLLPPGARPEDVAAFDTGPGNMACDALMQIISDGRQAYDRNGVLAASGRPDPRLLQRILRQAYFRKAPPKSCGREQFGRAWVERIVARRPRLAPADLMATLVAVTAQSVARGVARGGEAALGAEVIASGGGTRNRALMAALQQALPRCGFCRSEAFGVPSQAKEALAFALLGAAHLRGEAGNLPSATGARRAVVLGSRTPAPRRRG